MAIIKHISPLSFCICLGNSYSSGYHDPRPEIEDWCMNNINNTWHMHTIYISFSSKNDALAFKLRWT